MLQILNYGNCKRDITYIDDIIEGVMRVMDGALEKKVSTGEKSGRRRLAIATLCGV